jgi:hypothetical protein
MEKVLEPWHVPEKNLNSNEHTAILDVLEEAVYRMPWDPNDYAGPKIDFGEITAFEIEKMIKVYKEARFRIDVEEMQRRWVSRGWTLVGEAATFIAAAVVVAGLVWRSDGH